MAQAIGHEGCMKPPAVKLKRKCWRAVTCQWFIPLYRENWLFTTLQSKFYKIAILIVAFTKLSGRTCTPRQFYSFAWVILGEKKEKRELRCTFFTWQFCDKLTMKMIILRSSLFSMASWDTSSRHAAAQDAFFFIMKDFIGNSRTMHWVNPHDLIYIKANCAI